MKQLNQSLKNLGALSTENLNSVLHRSLGEVNIPNDFIDNLIGLSTIDISIGNIYSDDINDVIEQEDTDQLYQENNRDSIYDWVNNLCEKIINFPTKLKQQHPALYILYYIFGIIIVWNIVILPILQDSVKNQVFNEIQIDQQNPKNSVKELKKSLSQKLDYEYKTFNAVRVTTRPTVVYRSNKRKSGSIDLISSNKPVIILNKKKNWSLVLYTNYNNEEVTGWVFTGNLAK
ncbi:hypothetical protein [Mesobacillus selenatarsenatis]|nr:hypothetical protein [Mesobacillus selenatarsenatis]